MILRQIFLFCSLILVVGIFTYCRAEVSVDPFGIAVSLNIEDNDSLITELALRNNDESSVAFKIDLEEIDAEEEARLSRRKRGPRRDEAGDLIGSFEGMNQDGRSCTPVAWDWDYERMWVTYFSDSIAVAYTHNDEYDEFEEVIRIEPGGCQTGAWCKGIFFTVEDIRDELQRWDADGERLESQELEYSAFSLAADVEKGWLIVAEMIQPASIIVFEVDDQGFIGDQIGDIDYSRVNFPNWMTNNIEWVPAHENTGQLWTQYRGTVYQVLVDTDEWECINSENAVSFSIEAGGWRDAMAHDGYNMWAGGASEENIRIYDDGIEEIYIEWIVVCPDEGIIEADSSVEIKLTFASTNLEPGTYQAILQIELTEPEEERRDDLPALLEISVILTINDDVTTIFGTVTGARSEQSIENARLDIAPYIYTRFTDGEGNYRMDDLPLGEYTVTVTAPEFLPVVERFNIEEAGEFEFNVALLYSECTVEPDSVEAEVEIDNSEQFEIMVFNNGDGPLAYEIVKQLSGGANAAPWEHRRSYRSGWSVGDDSIEGIAYFNDLLYVAGGGNNVNRIYVFTRDGDLYDRFRQPGDTRNGLYDLTNDGELLWGGDNEHTIYGFDTDGEVAASWQGPERTNQAIAWDQDRELLWITGIISNEIVGYNREGERQASIDQFDLRIYGLAYWPNDPDGYQLYALNSPDQEIACVHKINLDEPDTMFVAELDHPDGGGPRGCFITREYDVYSYVFMAIANNGDQDRIDVWQIAGITSWMEIEPVEGVVGANESELFTLTLDATDLPDTTFEGQLVWIHDGVGGETALDLTLQVTSVDAIVTDRILPFEFGLNLVYPNPFNSATTVRFGIDRTEPASLIVYDLQGREIVRLFDRPKANIGNYRLIWDGGRFASGLYILKLRSGSRIETVKVALVR